MTTAADHRIVPHHPADLPELAAADRGVADSLEAVLSENTRRTYDAQWRLFDDWCAEVGLASLPANPLTVARYLAARAGSGASIATLRLAAIQPRKRGRGIGTPQQAADRARFDLALAPTHEIERQGRWKQGGGMVGRYTRGESAGSALRYL